MGEKRPAEEAVEQYVWVRVEGTLQADEYKVTGLRNVSRLLSEVYKNAKERLEPLHVSADLLRLYVNKATQERGEEPLNKGLSITDLLKRGEFSEEDPGFVDYNAPRREIAQALTVHSKGLQENIPEHPALFKKSVVETLTGTERQLINRKDALERLDDYVNGVVKRSTSAKFQSDGAKGWRICATVAATGMGKTAILQKFALRQATIEGRSVLFVQFNTDHCVPQHVCKLVGGTAEFCLSGSLLHAAGVDVAVLKRLREDINPDDVIQIIRSRRGMDESDILVVCVDELLQVDDEVLRRMFLKLCMELQGRMAGRFVVVFSAFAQKQVSGWTSRSGRQLYPVVLQAVPVGELVTALVEEVQEAQHVQGADTVWMRVGQWLATPDVQNVLSIISVHPRSLFEGFVNWAKDNPHTGVSTLHLIGIIFGRIDKLHDHIVAGKVVLCRWLTGGQELLDPKHTLIQDGLVYIDEDPEQPKQTMTPFLVRAIAYNAQDTTSERGMLQAIFDADVGIKKDTIVKSQDVVVQFECLLRCLHPGAVALERMFPYATIGNACRSTYSLRKTGTNIEIKSPDNFREPSRLWAILEAGHIAKSAKQNEVGIEYVSPLFHEDRLTAVLCVQVKGGRDLPKHKGRHLKKDDACETLLTWALESAKSALPGYEDRQVILIPVLIMVAEATPVSQEACGPAVQVIGKQVAQWLQLLRPLKWLDD